MEPGLKDIEPIYHAALEKEAGRERSAYLDAACGQNATLRAGVEALLRANEQAGDFLETPALGAQIILDTSPLTEGPGTVIGRYKLLEKIGEGGMAVVYMAEQQEPIRRKVALKIIKLGMDTRQVIARFEVEATGPGDDGPSQYRQGPRCRGHGNWPAVLRDGAGQGRFDHRILRPE